MGRLGWMVLAFAAVATLALGSLAFWILLSLSRWVCALIVAGATLLIGVVLLEGAGRRLS